MLVRVAKNLFIEEEISIRIPHKVAKVVRDVLLCLHDILIIPPDQKVIIKYLKDAAGEFHISSQVIFVNPFLSNLYGIISALCHEAVHSEQYFIGKTNLFVVDGKFYVVYDDVLFRNANLGDDNSPWEKEAYSREKFLAKKIIDILGFTYEEINSPLYL